MSWILLLGLAWGAPGDDLDGDGVRSPADCVDTDPTIFPGADEIVADGIDQDCDQVDACYYDFDGDGFGDAGEDGMPIIVLDSDTNCRNDSGLTADNADDCDDDDPNTNPDAEEVAANEIDENCDGFDGCYLDSDGDGYGGELGEAPIGQCGQGPSSLVADDCDDEDPETFPGAEEICDGVDNDCDGEIDIGAAGYQTWFRDFDDDGFGDPTDTLESCEAPLGFVDDATDCNDGDANSSPGADELCDGLDNDCDFEVDEDAIDAVVWRPDQDGDGLGSDSESVLDCFEPLDGRFWVIEDPSYLDCNDQDPFIGRCGCGCGTPGSGPSGAVAMLVLLMVGRRRRQA